MHGAVIRNLFAWCFLTTALIACDDTSPKDTTNPPDASDDADTDDGGVDGSAAEDFEFSQTSIGDIESVSVNGAWWGENITKVVRSSNKVFTFAMNDVGGDGDDRQIVLMERSDDGPWVEGATFAFARAPNLLIDSDERVHVVAFAPFDPAVDTFRGSIAHVRFDESNTVTGTYETTRLATDVGNEVPTFENYQTLFLGAAIGEDDTMLAAYNNSVMWNTPGTHSLAVQIYDPGEGTWTYDQVAANMGSRFAYPFAFVSNGYFHVYAVEDEYDTDYATLGPPYDGYLFRYGAVKHFQRPRSGGPWTETTLVDFNGVKSKAEIWDMILRTLDLHVDSEGRIHALLRYNEGTKPRVYHYTKLETEDAWESEALAFPGTDVAGLYWAKLWDRGPERGLHFVGAVWSQQIRVLTPAGATHVVSDLAGDDLLDPTPFLSSARAGNASRDLLDIAVFSGSAITTGEMIRCEAVVR
jgi:hypothetical protein